MFITVSFSREVYPLNHLHPNEKLLRNIPPGNGKKNEKKNEDASDQEHTADKHKIYGQMLHLTKIILGRRPSQ